MEKSAQQDALGADNGNGAASKQGVGVQPFVPEMRSDRYQQQALAYRNALTTIEELLRDTVYRRPDQEEKAIRAHRIASWHLENV